MTATYATPIELARFMGIEGVIPDRDIVGDDRLKEEVGSGTGTQTRYFLDKAYIIDATLKSGRTESTAGTTLTIPDEYSLDKDRGEITLTTSGTAIIGTTKLFAEYSYVKVGITHTQLQESLDRAEKHINDHTNNLFVDGNTITPAYEKVTNEKHDGKGRFDRDYFTRNFPLPNLSTSLSATLTTSSGTVHVSDSNGFPNDGFLLIDSDKILYSGKDSGGTAFTQISDVSASHSVQKNY